MCLKLFPKSCLSVHLISPVYQLHLCYFGVDSNALSLISCICRHGCDAMAIANEIESENEDLDL